MEARKRNEQDGITRGAVIPFKSQHTKTASDDEMIAGMIQEAMDMLVRAQTVLHLSRARANRKPPGLE